jgi:hypothetical protein
MKDGKTNGSVNERPPPIRIVGRIALVLFGSGLVLVGFCTAILGTGDLYIVQWDQPAHIP